MRVKYMVLLYDNPNARNLLTPEHMSAMQVLMGELTASGELLGTEGLADPSQTTTVRVVDGVPAVTDGPFAEVKEHMGGYLLIDVESAARAVEIAFAWPAGLTAAIELRPLMTQGGPDE